MLTKSLLLPLLIWVGLLLGGFACQGGSAAAQSGSDAGIYADIDATTFATKMEEGTNVVLLDVRTPGEIARGKIAGAIEMDFNSEAFAQQLTALDKDKTYLVYCASGVRSGKTCQLMQEQGFRECYNLLGGYNNWKK